VQPAPRRAALNERNGVLEEVRNRSIHAGNQNEVTMNPMIIVILGLALCVDYRLAGLFLMLVGIFAVLTTW
jgi:hypothetical protein